MASLSAGSVTMADDDDDFDRATADSVVGPSPRASSNGFSSRFRGNEPALSGTTPTPPAPTQPAPDHSQDPWPPAWTGDVGRNLEKGFDAKSTDPEAQEVTQDGVRLYPINPPGSEPPAESQLASGFFKGGLELLTAPGEAFRKQFAPGTAAKSVEEFSPEWGPGAIDAYRKIRGYEEQRRGAVEDWARLGPAAIALMGTRGRSPTAWRMAARAITGAGIGALEGQERGGGTPYLGGTAGAIIGGLSDMLHIPKSSLAILAAELYRNPRIRQFFGAQTQTAGQPAQSTATPARPDDPYSVENLRKKEDAGRTKAEDNAKQWEQERKEREEQDRQTEEQKRRDNNQLPQITVTPQDGGGQ